MAELTRGLVQVYTGDGKGKTTAAFGLALRALGQGLRVCVYQFLKPPAGHSGEAAMADRLGPMFRLVRLDEPWSIAHSGDDRQISAMAAAIRRVLPEIRAAVASGEWNVVILDEIVFCLSRGLISEIDLLELIAARDRCVEMVLTGRGASDALVEAADLVTEMVAVKHPCESGVVARAGIEY